MSFSYRIRQCVCSSMIRFVSCIFFINKQFRTCPNAFPNDFTVRSYEYCAGKHWILFWIQENKTATHYLRSRLFTYDIMKNFSAVSIKHRILATFNKKKNQFWQPLMPLMFRVYYNTALGILRSFLSHTLSLYLIYIIVSSVNKIRVFSRIIVFAFSCMCGV